MTDAQYKPIHIISRGVIIDNDHILLTYHPTSEHLYTNLPGGHVEWNESIVDAVLRELLEETGEIFKDPLYLGILEYSFHRPKSSQEVFQHEINFIFQVESDHVKYPNLPTSPEKDCAFKWLSLKEFPSSNLLPEPLKDLVPSWLDSTKKPSLASYLTRV